MGLKNFSVFAAHKNMPGALETLVKDPDLKLDALILPGHVGTITGTKPFEFLAKEYGIPGVVTGFEPVDVLQGIAMIMRQLHEGRAEIEIAYARGVMPQGNPVALAAIDEVFETCTATWRGLGDIPRQRIPYPREVRAIRCAEALPARNRAHHQSQGLPLRRRPACAHGAQRVPALP